MEATFKRYKSSDYKKVFQFEFIDFDGKKYTGFLAYVDTLRSKWSFNSEEPEEYDQVTWRIIKALHEKSDVSVDINFKQEGKGTRFTFVAKVKLTFDGVLIDKFKTIGKVIGNEVVFDWNAGIVEKPLYPAIKAAYEAKKNLINIKRFLQ